MITRICVPVLALLSFVDVSGRGETLHTQGVAVTNRAPLAASAFYAIPLGAIQPKGWLLQQEKIQAAGLTGHLDEFWDDVGANSGWLGGSGESWERGPYYLDGLLPLAFQLGDDRLIAKAKKWVEWSLKSQRADGQFGPAKNDDWWPRMVMLKVITQYAEATGDPRVIPFMSRYFKFELEHLPAKPLEEWGKFRWQDNALTVVWLYNRTGDAGLLSLIKLLHQQGFDWESNFNKFPYKAKLTAAKIGFDTKGPHPFAMPTHGVNNAMALKTAPLWWLLSHDSADRSAIYQQLEMLDKYHGLPNGMFSADEHLAGIDPAQGIELCAVVEAMFSYEEAFAILGDSTLADRLERISYNALPATLSDDMWSHQYDQQPNQIACTRAKRQWSTNGNDSNLFGLEPNFGCCTANLHQGWPKLVSSLWMATRDNGLVTTAYGPNELNTALRGKKVSIDEETEYPFRPDVKLVIHVESATNFPLWLRVPGWAKEYQITINGKPQAITAKVAAKHGFVRIVREWNDNDVVQIALVMEPRVTHWANDSAVFERGPLVFSKPLKGEWKALEQHGQKSADWQITTNDAWNYAVRIGGCASVAKQHEAGVIPFDEKNPSVELQVEMKRLPDWAESENSRRAHTCEPGQVDRKV